MTPRATVRNSLCVTWWSGFRVFFHKFHHTTERYKKSMLARGQHVFEDVCVFVFGGMKRNMTCAIDFP